jgi:hypothetical protein
MLDLNSKEFNTGSSIFNNGTAGKVDNTTITVKKRGADEPETYPDYKLIVTDAAGNSLNQGFFYPKDNAQKSPEDNKKRANIEIGRVLHIAKAVVGDDYEFPAVKTAKEAFDMLFKLIAKNAGDKKFSVFVTYGTKNYISKYLGLRYFTFIEPTELPAGKSTRLTVAMADQMERVVEDAPLASAQTESASSEEEDDDFTF